MHPVTLSLGHALAILGLSVGMAAAQESGNIDHDPATVPALSGLEAGAGGSDAPDAAPRGPSFRSVVSETEDYGASDLPRSLQTARVGPEAFVIVLLVLTPLLYLFSRVTSHSRYMSRRSRGR